jgi:hypothetical protein
MSFLPLALGPCDLMLNVQHSRYCPTHTWPLSRRRKWVPRFVITALEAPASLCAVLLPYQWDQHPWKSVDNLREGKRIQNAAKIRFLGETEKRSLYETSCRDPGIGNSYLTFLTKIWEQWRTPYPGTRVGLVRTDSSEKTIVSIIGVERICELVTTLAITSTCS